MVCHNVDKQLVGSLAVNVVEMVLQDTRYCKSVTKQTFYHKILNNVACTVLTFYTGYF